MLNFCSKKSIFHRIIVVFCVFTICNINYIPFSQAKEMAALTSKGSFFESISTKKFKISELKDSLTAFGASFSTSETKLASIDPNFEFSVSCHGEKFRTDPRIANVTAGCRAISVLSPVSVTLALPYDPKAIPEGQSEQEIRVFDLSRVASGGPMAPLDTYVDVENKKTLTTLKEQASHFINGVLKIGERPEKAPVSFSDEILKPVLEANPTAGYPMIKAPEANTDGDLRLSYPIEFPGARSAFKPSVSIGYSAQSRGGNIADGWRIDVPSISVETRWGVPVYDNRFETETYLFNGDQLVPEGGDYLPTAQDTEFFEPTAPKAVPVAASPEQATAPAQAGQANNDPLAKPDEVLKDRLHLVPVPHRTSKLREREREGARFVLRKGEGSWRFVRHGNTPANYWWEAWQENPSGDVKTLYFGNAPGRLNGDVPLPSTAIGKDRDEPLLRRDWSGGDGEPITRWALARERDAHGNLIDYDWRATCAGCVAGEVPTDRELYLGRVVYTHHTDIEETILRCREKPDLPGCNRKQGLYEAQFNWESAKDNAFQVRSEARSGGLTVSGQVLRDIAFRFRTRAKPYLGTNLVWTCSAPFMGYAFAREADPLFRGHIGSRPRLTAITKIVHDTAEPIRAAEDEIALHPAPMGASCGTTIAPPQGTTLVSRFAYRTVQADQVYNDEKYKYNIKEANLGGFSQPALEDELDIARGFVSKLVNSQEKGPFAPSFLGTSTITDLGFGTFLGVGFPSKALSVGVNFQKASRTSQTEVTSLLDVDGDGIIDLLALRGGRWVVHKGSLGKNLQLTFAKGSTGLVPQGDVPLGSRLPHGFRFQYEPTSSTTNTGFEANFAPAMFGSTNGGGNTVQRHYLADMDGDGRIDVVTPSGVFYNTTNRRNAENIVTMAPDTRFIAGRQSVAGQAATPVAAPAPLPAKPDLKPAAAEAPLYDAVRVWKAPFAGRVTVKGAATYAGADDGIKGWAEFAAVAAGALTSPNPDERLTSHHQARDGAMVSIEHEQGSTVKLCQAGLLGPGVLTPPRVPTPDQDNLWRIEGSVFVRENTEAFYVLRLTGHGGTRPARIKLVPEIGSALSQADLDKAVDDAITRWKAPAGLDAGKLTAANGVVTFEGNVEMWPLVISLKPPKPAVGQGASFGIRLEQPTGESSSQPDFDPSGAAIKTGIFPAVFTPSGTNCVPPTGGATAADMTIELAAGDILSFRVHSFDDGNGDAVNWNPEITYQEVWRSISDRTALFAIPSASIASRETACLPGEPVAGLCDGVGRSLVRYRAASLRKNAPPNLNNLPVSNDDYGDWPALVYAAGEYAAPAGGRFRFSGKFRKPNTLGILELAYAKLTKNDPSCIAHAGGSYKPVRLKRGETSIAAADLSAGEYEIDSVSTGDVKIDSGERICLKFRLLIDQGVPLPHYTPYDAAGIDLPSDAPISLMFDRLSQLDRGEPELKGTKAPETVPDNECGNNPSPPSVPPGQTAKYVCNKSDLSIRLTPHADRGASTYFTAGASSGKAIQTDNPSPVLMPVKPWATELSQTSGLCKAGEVERRMRIDVSSLRAFNTSYEKLTANSLDQNFARLKIALRRYPATNSSAPDQPLRFRLFGALSPNPQTGYLPLTDSHLAYESGAWTYVHDANPEQTDFTIAFSRTDLSSLMAPDPSIPLAGVVPTVGFKVNPADPRSLVEAGKVGLVYCAQPGDMVSMIAALDANKPMGPPNPAQNIAETLIGTECVDRQSSPPDPTPQNPIPRRIRAMCPLTSVALLSVEQLPGLLGAQPSYNAVAHPLSIAMEPGSDRFGRSGGGGLMPLTHRGANVVFPLLDPQATNPKLICDTFGRDDNGARTDCMKSQADLEMVPRLKPLASLTMAIPGLYKGAAEQLGKYADKSVPFPPGCVGSDAGYDHTQCSINSTIDSTLKLAAFSANAIYRPETFATAAPYSPGTEVSCLNDVVLPNQSKPNERHNLCGMGPDPAMFVHEGVISSSRLGTKNIHEGDNRDAILARARQIVLNQQIASAPSPSIQITVMSNGRGLQGADKRSTMKHWGNSAGAGISSTSAHNTNDALVDMIDMNGDGFPDLVEKGRITFTDPRGRIRCENDGVWKEPMGCNPSDQLVGGASVVRTAKSNSSNLSVNVMGIVNTYPTAKATAQGPMASSSGGVAQNPSPSSVMTVFGLGSFDSGENAGSRAFDIVDVNGDGLPDLVTVVTTIKPDGTFVTEAKVRLNLGYRFSDPVDWPQADLFRDTGKNKGLSAGPPSFSTDNGAFAGGITTATSASDQNQTVADINGDGLTDVVKFGTDGKVSVRLGTGQGLTGWIDLGNAGVNAAGRTETDRVSTGGAYTFYQPIWPLPPITLIFNPNASRTAASSRQTTLFRDMDGDGLPDVVKGEGLFAHGTGVFPIDKLGFDNKAAEVRLNGLGQHGLLERVWQATNTDTQAAANLEFTYARTAKTARDPNHRYVLFRTVTRDGVKQDDYAGAAGSPVNVTDNMRATCYFYTGGFHDRFERRFLGYRRVDTLEACDPLQPSPHITDAGDANATAFRGIRRTEREYANGTHYESGLLLSEKTYDLTKTPTYASRSTVNTYVMMDTGRATHAIRRCQLIRTPRPLDRFQNDLLAKGFVRDVFFRIDPNVGIGEPGCDSHLTADNQDTNTDPSFDIAPRRLLPVKVQVVNEARESSDDTRVLRTAMQFEYDYLGRPIRVCDLGAVTRQGDTIKTRGAVCSGLTYDDTVRPSFTHGATGGGVLAIEQQNRVKKLVVVNARPIDEFAVASDRTDDPANAPEIMQALLASDAPRTLQTSKPAAGKILRRRSAVHDPQTGAVVALCVFDKPEAVGVDPCAGFRHFPTAGSAVFNYQALKAAANAGVALRSYSYDTFGNILAFIGPVGSSGGFIRKDYHYDRYLNSVETAERTHLCTNGNAQDKEALCLDQASKLGALVSISTGIDYRFATPTTTIDVNRNMNHMALDGLGRPSVLYINGPDIGGSKCDTTGNCPLALTAASSEWRRMPVKQGGITALRRIATLAYDLHGQGGTITPRVVTTRFSNPVLYKGSSADAPFALKTAILTDHMGEKVQTITANQVCAFGQQSCQTPFVTVATALVRKDVLGRPASTGYAKGLDVAVESAGLTETGPVANTVSYDGLDRVIGVQLPDQNSYALRYAIEKSRDAAVGGALRHVTYTRNAVCVPSAIERDVRGEIRSVVEAFEQRSGAPDGSAADGSSIDLKTSTLLATVGGIGSAQQVASCKSNPSDFGVSGLKTTVTAYDRDVLGQLVAVRLPLRTGESEAKRQAIQVGYDGLGRRMAVNDPDRGFERILHDTAGNAVCRYSGRHKATLVPTDLDLTPAERTSVQDGICPDPKGKDWSSGSNDITRKITTVYAANLPLSVRHEEKGPNKGEPRAVTFAYGESSALTLDCAATPAVPTCENQVGRVRAIQDNVGSLAKAYDVLGRTTKTTRDYAKMDIKTLKQVSVTTQEAFDIWGLSAGRTVSTTVPPLSDNDPDISVDHTIRQTYSLGGQLKTVTGTTRTVKAGVTTTDIQPVVLDMRYDERGNMVTMRHSTGVETINRYDLQTNRLLASASTVGGVAGNTADILFQNLGYEYGAAGNILRYRNQPQERRACVPDAPYVCVSNVSSAMARQFGLLIDKSEHKFAYDQLNRLARADKSATTVLQGSAGIGINTALYVENSSDGEPQLFNSKELDAARKLELTVNETFDFQSTHEMTRHVQAITHRRNELAFPKTPVAPSVGSLRTERRTSVYEPSPDHRHAPRQVKTTTQSVGTSTNRLSHDTFGRLLRTRCLESDRCVDRRTFEWNSDDTMRLQVARIADNRLPSTIKGILDAEAKQNGVTKNQFKEGWYSNRIDSEFDHGGNRIFRRNRIAFYIPQEEGPKAIETLSDTLYIDPSLTITRRPGAAPQAMVHYFAGGTRVASQWLGDNHLFGYHSQLLTRNVSDVVVAKFDKVAGSDVLKHRTDSTRLHSQQEYAAFGRVVHEREMALDPSATKPVAARKHPGLPAYRFNAKEEDDSGLQDFGARFYDNRMALWLRPDPVLHDYLNGKHNGGVYAPKNLASYGFGWGNPVGFVDSDGQSPEQADDFVRTSFTSSMNATLGPFKAGCTDDKCTSNIPSISNIGNSFNVLGFGVDIGGDNKSASINLKVLKLSGSIDDNNKVDSLKISFGAMEKDNIILNIKGMNFKFGISGEALVSYEHVSKSVTYDASFSVAISKLNASVDGYSGLKRVDKLPITAAEGAIKLQNEFYKAYGVGDFSRYLQ